MEGTNILKELGKIQKKCGYLKKAEMIKLSKAAGVPVSRIYAAATFYSFLSTEKKGRHVIRVCNNLPCIANGSGTALKCLRRILKIRPGETTKDGKFSLETTSCIGCCDKPPAMMINNKVFTNLTEKKIAKIIRKLR
jgi:NADH-quinone oxidoreductase subunit E